MLVIISPAKTLDFKTNINYDKFTLPEHLKKSELLIRNLQKMTPRELSSLMNISSKLAMLNYQRFKEWTLPFYKDNARQAVFAFKGEVFTGLNIKSFSNEELEFTQEHILILSGLYGTLRPFDLIKPYRLEMGTKLSVKDYKNLYEFWSNNITQSVQSALNKQGDDFLINLASDEYFKSINKKQLKAHIITPLFKEYKNGTYKFISVYGKKARGMMTRFILRNKLKTINDLKLFEEEGYYYNENLSSKDTPIFTRS